MANKLDDLKREQGELRKMIEEGVSFDIELTYKKRKPGLLGYLRKREKVTERRLYTIKEPTLSTLDRLSELWLALNIDETKLQEDEYLDTAKQMASEHALTLAQVVAVAVLGEDYYDVTERGGAFIRKPNEKRLRDLTEIFAHAITPAQLFTIAVLITNTSNLGDFTASIRLMSASRTSIPINRIEQQD